MNKVLKGATARQNQRTELWTQQTRDQLGHPSSLIRVFTVHMKKRMSLAFHWAHCKDSDQVIWVFAGHKGHFVGFCCATAQICFKQWKTCNPETLQVNTDLIIVYCQTMAVPSKFYENLISAEGNLMAKSLLKQGCVSICSKYKIYRKITRSVYFRM